MLLVDAHVHVYHCFDLDDFIRSAIANFQAAARALGGPGEHCPILVLTDWFKQTWFEDFRRCVDDRDLSRRMGVPAWRFQATPDPEALMIAGPAGEGLYLLAGRKIISEENLEVLALGTTHRFQDGMPLAATLEAIAQAPGAPIPVVPWAVGKWLGRRGQVLAEVLRNAPVPFYLCDNGNRPAFWGRPRHFDLAARTGIPLLAGSDPLHFPSEVHRAGRFGFVLPGNLTGGHPVRELKAALTSAASSEITLFGPMESAWRFLRNQALMQVFKKKWKKELRA
jgi:hypothetical protein